MAKKTLNDQHERFCKEYLKDLNLTQAYARVYPDATATTARANGSKLLTNTDIQERIQELMKARNARIDLDGDKVVQRLANIAFGHLGMICVWTESGLEIKDQDELTEQELAIIAEIDMSPVSDGDGGLLGYRKKVRMKDSLKALELLSKHLGLLDGTDNGKRDKEVIQKRIQEAARRVRGKA